MIRSFRPSVVLCVVTAVAFIPVIALAAPETQPGESAVAASRPASQPAGLDPAVERILDRLEAKGKVIKDIQCKLEYVKEDPTLQSKQVFTGVLLYKDAEPNPHFFIRFDKSVNDGVVSNKKEWHVFDGQWYIEARESTTSVGKHQVLRPGEKKELFRIGKGPFPLPFGQNKADILENFTVKLVPPVKGDPEGTDHLQCTPLPGTELAEKYGTVHFYIDRKLDLPVRLTTFQKEDDLEITASFTDPKLNTGLAGSELQPPEPSGWSITEDRLPPEGEK